jgi:hypothetical protein
MKINKHSQLVIFTLAGLLAISGLIMSGISKSQSSWVKAQGNLGQGLLTKIITENSAQTINPETIKVMKLNSGINLIDFNSKNLCGQAGCLYVAYTNQGNRVLNVILQPQPNLFTITQKSLPCLNIKQPQGKQIIQHTYCYEGDTFIKTISSAIN